MTIATRVVGRAGAGWCAAAIALLALAGCQTQPQQPDSTAQIVTPSDEPEHRRRARIRLQLASSYFEEGKTEVALDELKQALAADPSFPDAYNLRGLIYLRLNDARQAEDSFKRALALNPRDSDTHHNYGWLLCQQGRHRESIRAFEQAVATPLYAGRAKTFMALGVCQARAGLHAEAERSLARSYELDAANPITGFNLAQLLYRRGDFPRAQFYIRRLNNSELANAESLWLGIKVERRMNDNVAMEQLADQLKRRFPQSKERQAWDRRDFNE